MEKTILVCDRCGKELSASDCLKVCVEASYKCNTYQVLGDKPADLCDDCYKKFADYIKKFFEPVENEENHTCSCGGNCGGSHNCHNEKEEEINPIICDCFDNGRCNGTRERDECSCEGNPINCDFYDYIKVKGAKAYYDNYLDPKYRCPYWSTGKDRKRGGEEYEVCRDSQNCDKVKCHGDLRNCQFAGKKTIVDKFSSKINSFIKE